MCLVWKIKKRKTSLNTWQIKEEYKPPSQNRAQEPKYTAGSSDAGPTTKAASI